MKPKLSKEKNLLSSFQNLTDGCCKNNAIKTKLPFIFTSQSFRDDNLMNKLSQSMEDSKMKSYINSEAHRLCWKWMNAEEITIGEHRFKNCLLIIKPPHFYVVHDDKTAKYLHSDINELVRIELKSFRMSTKKCKSLCKKPYCKSKKGRCKAYCHKHHAENQKLNNPIGYTFNILRCNAVRRGKEFAITLDYFKQWCAETGYMETKGITKEKMTIDRDNQELGYVPGNLRIMKNDDNRKKYVEYFQNKKQEEGDIVVGNLDEVDF